MANRLDPRRGLLTVHPASGPTAFAQFPALEGLGLDLPIEAVDADGLVLVECEPSVDDGLVVERATAQVWIWGMPLVFIAAEGEAERMRSAARHATRLAGTEPNDPFSARHSTGTQP